MSDQREIVPIVNVESIQKGSKEVFFAISFLTAISAFLSHYGMSIIVDRLFDYSLIPYGMMTFYTWSGTILLTPLVSYLLLGVLMFVAVIVISLIKKVCNGKAKA